MRNIDLLEKHDRSLKIVVFFKNTPWAEEYNGLERELLLNYLQVSYLDDSGHLYKRDSKFLDNIEVSIRQEKDRLAAIKTPPPLAPDFTSKLEDMMAAYEAKENSGAKNPKKFLLTDIKETSKILRQQWELKRQEVLTKEIEGEIHNTQAKIFSMLEPELKTAGFKTDEINEIIDVATLYSHKLTTKKEEPGVLLEETLKEVLQIKGTANPEQEAFDLTKGIENDTTIAPELFFFSKSLRDLEGAMSFSQRYEELLQDKAAGAPIIRNQEFEKIHLVARNKISEFVENLRGDLKNAGFTDAEINQKRDRFIDYIHLSTSESPLVSARSYSQNNFKEVLGNNIYDAISTYFNPRGVRSLIPVVNRFVAADENTKFNNLQSKARSLLESDPSLTITLQTASYNTYSANKNSIEGGDPIGRIPYVIRIKLLGAENPQQIDNYVHALKAKHAGGELSLSPAQITALETASSYIKTFHNQHPNLSKITSFYYQHTIGISLTKAFGSQILWHPDYSLYIPVQLGKIYFSQNWELYWKPSTIDWAVKNLPLKGLGLGVWYKKNDWGLYENPLERAKHAVGNFVVKKSINFTGKVTYKIGHFFGSEKITNTGLKLLSGELLGKLAGIWTIGGAIITKTLKYVGLGIGAIFLWATSYGIPGLIGFGLSFTAGIAAGIKMGLIASAVGGPIVGIVVGAITTLVVTFLGTGLTVWLLSHGLLPSFGGLGISTASAGGLATATSGLASAALPITGVFLVTTVGANLLYNQFLQAGFNPYRSEGLSSTYTQIQSNNLNEIFKQTADQVCIPLAALKSISKIEASRTWSYTDEEVAKFSTSGWWKTASQEELKRGYCVDTCLTNDCAKINRKTNTYCQPGDGNPDCKKTTVFGPMQFEEITWANRFSCKRNSDGTFDNDCLMERCNLKTVIVAAAEKIKANSNDKETGPCDSTTKSWDKNTMMCRVAQSYCGSCGTDWCNNTKRQECSLAPLSEEEIKTCLKDPNCGEDYCGTAWTNYQGGGGK